MRNLRRRGADVTIVVPWARKSLLLDPPPFGVDVPVVTLDIEVPSEAVSGGAWSPYSNAGMAAPYGRGMNPAWSPYYSGWSPYGGGGALWSGYTSPGFGANGGVYGGAYGGPYGGYGTPYGGYGGPYGGSYGFGGAGNLSGSILFRLIGAFARRLVDYVANEPTDLIHAHDWVTFDAARARLRTHPRAMDRAFPLDRGRPPARQRRPADRAHRARCRRQCHPNSCGQRTDAAHPDCGL
ncbi:MAG: hypothetical protein WDN04_00890 [Rhodospirillales bacterium]